MESSEGIGINDIIAEILIIADELEEFSRIGRQMSSRKYYDTMAHSNLSFGKNDRAKSLSLNIIGDHPYLLSRGRLEEDPRFVRG